MSTKSVSLEVRNVTKVFSLPGGGSVTAVKECNFQVQPGEFLTLLGPSGCGKTTLLRMIAGFEEPTTGAIYMNGAPIEHLPPQSRDMAMVFQNYALFPHMNVYENVAYSLTLRKERRAEVSKRVADMLKLVGLSGMEQRSTGHLSGGQQQRVALARALAKRPSVLLLDEPLSNLDAKLRIETRYELKNIQRELGITTIYVTHDQEEAMFLSDRIILMNEGVIHQVGSPQQVYQEPSTKFVASFLGSANFIPVQQVKQSGKKWWSTSLGGKRRFRTPRITNVIWSWFGRNTLCWHQLAKKKGIPDWWVG